MNVFGTIIKGGLGNMLFCIATGEWLSYKHNMEVVYPNISFWFKRIHDEYDRISNTDEYARMFKDFDWHKNQDRKDEIKHTVRLSFRYEEIIPKHGHLYDSYFQSYKNFDIDFVRNRLRPADHIVERLNKYTPLFNVNTSCIHVRRGDYITKYKSHPVQDMSYYNKAITLMRDNHVERFLVFSDDIAWCKSHFIGDEFIFITDDDYVEIFLMAMCRNGIIANSSFSCFSALYGKMETVIYPSNWFTNNNPDASDICPPEWMKI